MFLSWYLEDAHDSYLNVEEWHDNDKLNLIKVSKQSFEFLSFTPVYNIYTLELIFKFPIGIFYKNHFINIDLFTYDLQSY